MPRQRDDKLPVNWTVHSWERGYQHVPVPDVIVWIDIETFDRLWWLSDQYIAAPGDASDNQPHKYAKAGRRFLAGEPMWMPEVGQAADGSLTFRDGRHRYLWMREHGALAMPVAVEQSEAPFVRKLCGTRQRTSWFIPPRSKVPTPVVLGILGLAVAGLVAVARA
ncbi:hypothetical protein MCBMB27_05280 [Methylobacterium phyllosphaerae]|uniref:Uncharacterized protein n=1 Tax=Methylobacterium phyllosphaerae TaxID=418223 RepID=A0AAE8L7M3_9HYPH|nr:hypothetical protein MCBMB27_05280 [Methylobacterium phyllosphaerae]SFH19003.1 hypothetical protein SAMN05192567_11617 [Methylobacterium phyllosphaerae]